MIWVDRIAKQLGDKTQHIDDMFTPSGYAHMGSLRGPILHDVVAKVLASKNKDTIFTYVFNDFDPIDGLPPQFQKDFSQYMGYSLRLAPSPDKKHKNFAEYFSEDFKHVLESLGLKAKYLSSWDMYHEGKFNDVIKTALDKKEKILEVYRRVAGYQKKAENWYPLQVVCPKCNKLGTTKVSGWDGKIVTFTCEPNLVTWAKGCSYSGTISPFDGNGKLPWKVDWPAHWKVLGITFEGAGKDHASKGGSYDISFALCDDVFNYPRPFYFPYEFFLFGGKKMSSSKGIGLKARDLTSILPSDLARFLIVRMSPEKTLEFNPVGDSIPNLLDDYDRCLNAYFLKLENKIPEKKAGDIILDFARIIELSEVNPLPKKRLFLPRFRTVTNLLKTNKANLNKFFSDQKKSELNSEEKAILEERIKYARIYLEKYAEENSPTTNYSLLTTKLSVEQKDFLKKLSARLKILNVSNKDEFQKTVFDSIKQSGLDPKSAFQAFYLVLTGKPYGPKAGDLIKQLGKEKTLELLNSAKSKKETVQKYLFPILNKPEIFSVDPIMAEKYPSINIGIAIIKGVAIKKNDPELSKEIEEFTKSQKSLSNEIISAYPEIQSYRRIYKEMGLDWHSKRPSPEALLRRIALNKGLYNINTCVDAYNLIVMKYHVSSGAFDLDKIKFPTVLRFPREGEEILLLGDKEPIKYKTTDLAYFDQIGGYNIYFNYRDAQRTAVSEDTKNILLNIDGIYTINREQVERSLKENIEIITKYCGGKVDLAGVVSAS
ncbi:lysine--tRNA ligase [Candidatus Roizmanbacteria bacterium RIFCSPHIGHO2_01_FULL_39_12c]|uniref:Lysine--tRNA ligase n=1 Tax=Candidatus Roizmanbacteria bacterium RIFCSPHIGHO2_01_FULL_39_12c TaxID=1802031 RepID=A0A1F7GE06_9BACT|nr:MAG: lysine--tRNA ligase [Candidatus Roizmanbacteria bacterium RIFCSPHIGHO2_01_FULL_39_12c]OGK46889.1 MAG: lysine--tRNA ligase [Candidatus Roizmanbacteria bacterium RIFCSPLOWO2_01_FULL_40_13]